MRDLSLIRTLIAFFALSNVSKVLIACTLTGAPIYQQLPHAVDPNSTLEVSELVPWVEVTAHLIEGGQSVVAEVCFTGELPAEGITPLAVIKIFDENTEQVWTLRVVLIDGVTEMVIIED